MTCKVKSLSLVVMKVLTACLVIALLLVVISIFAQRASGEHHPMVLNWCMAKIETGSMAGDNPDSFDAGSVVAIHEVDSNDIVLNDIVTYIDNLGRSVTHRVVSIDGDTVVTKGDANNAADEPFNKSQIIGRVEWSIPHVGHVINFLSHPVSVAILSIGLLLLAFLPTFTHRKSQFERREVQ